MRTVLYDEHVKLGGKIVDFAGWEMHLWYKKGQSAEHHATRKAVGIFDICHMGEFDIIGKESKEMMSGLLTNDVIGMEDGQASYNFMLNEKGGVIDDCIIYKFNDEKWMLVVNAGNIKTDFEWLKKNAVHGVTLTDKSDNTAKLDLQGPNAPKIIRDLAGAEALEKFGFFRFRDNVMLKNIPVLLSRTGYTGEIGFEIYCDVKYAVELWNLLLATGEKYGIEPCGLGARDSLRTEAGLPLHGHEIHPDIPALATPWDFVFKWEHDFIGKDALSKIKATGIKSCTLPFVMNGRSKAMHGWNANIDGKKIGHVVSGVISPTLENKPIGFLFSEIPLESGTKLTFNEDGKTRILEGEISTSPFVKPTSRMKMKNFL
ncbi:MAG: glycine cleavage system aminomethyltransferase GcvT [Candidatus Delongbacteria bacterium]|nr:glycine cleavage system aminomethyltransferase GcvT [Candidatus Delongbacteria bacterium]MCG2759715.1 glycine cleavage system aminomethyltransferase GcvT [Candidatus Delongbacteria bacterium]